MRTRHINHNKSKSVSQNKKIVMTKSWAGIVDFELKINVAGVAFQPNSTPDAMYPDPGPLTALNINSNSNGWYQFNDWTSIEESIWTVGDFPFGKWRNFGPHQAQIVYGANIVSSIVTGSPPVLLNYINSGAEIRHTLLQIVTGKPTVIETGIESLTGVTFPMSRRLGILTQTFSYRYAQPVLPPTDFIYGGGGSSIIGRN